MDIEAIIQHCEDLYNDLDFRYVKDWKQKHQAKAIGFMPVYVPRELIHAAGMLPVGIMGGGDSIEIISGDSYFQSYICRIPRSTIELGVSGRLNFLDGLLFPAICDVIRNLSGMWKILFPDKYVKYLDFPQNFTESGRIFYRKELGQLAGDLENISGHQITKANLQRAIELYNQNRRVIRELYDLRCRLPHKVPTYELYLLMRVSNILEVEEHTALLQNYLAAAQQTDRPERDYVKVIVSGAFCEQPPLNLIKALESSGCYIVDDDWVLGARYQLQDVPLTDEPLEALLESYFANTVATASRHEEAVDKGRFLLQCVKERQAEGVIFCAPSFCDPALLERPMLQAALSDAKVPYTSFMYAENTGQIHVIKEQTGTFADSIKLWGGV